jgi:hypothetical protein
MATAQKSTRGTQLLKTETTGTVQRFFDRRNGAFVAAVDVSKLPTEALHRAGMHGITQNLLDSSNKLEGDERIAHIKQQAEIVQAGGWASAPTEVNIDAAKAKMIAALIASGKSPDEAAKMVAGLGI